MGVLKMSTFAADGKTVFVRDYLRLRFGKWEHVSSHYRNRPRS
jgi:hypothetical protein